MDNVALMKKLEGTQKLVDQNDIMIFFYLSIFGTLENFPEIWFHKIHHQENMWIILSVNDIIELGGVHVLLHMRQMSHNLNLPKHFFGRIKISKWWFNTLDGVFFASK